MVKCKSGYLACEQPITPVPEGCPDHGTATKASKSSKKKKAPTRGLRAAFLAKADVDHSESLVADEVDTDDDSIASLLPTHGHDSAAGAIGSTVSRSMMRLQQAQPYTTGRSLLEDTPGCTNNGGFNSLFYAYGPKQVVKGR